LVLLSGEQKEEKELEKLREQERVRAGKELLAAKRQEDELKLKRNLELRRIEKEEEARARERIRQKLGNLLPMNNNIFTRVALF
jgi:UBX domain-containing protein 1/4